MKSIFMFGALAMAVLALAVVPAALAEKGGQAAPPAQGGEGNGAMMRLGPEYGLQARAGVNGTGNITGNATLLQAREQVREQIQEGRDQLKAGQAQLREDAKQFQEQMKTRMQAAQAQLQQLKQQYDGARARFQQGRSQIQDDREQFAACANQTNSSACNAVQQRIRGEAKPYLLNSADLVLNALDRVKATIEANAGLSAEEKASIIATIDARIQAMQQAQLAAGNLTNQSSAADIREAAREMRDSWNGTRPVLTLAAGQAVNAQLGNIIQSVEQLSTKLNATRDRLASQGRDVSALDARMADFSQKLSLAEQEWQAATDALNQTNVSVSDAVKAAHDHVQQAKEYLTEIRSDLRDIVNEIRQANNGQLVIGGDANATTNATTNATLNVTTNATVNVTANLTGNETGDIGNTTANVTVNETNETANGTA